MAAKEPSILVANGVRKTFRMGDSEIQVLKSVNLAVAPGEFIAIEGRSGSGKSTLLHILGALDESNGGEVMFDGRDVAKLSSAERAVLRCTQFGFVFQFYHLLPELNVLENTMLSSMIQNSLAGFRAKKRELAGRARELLGQMGLEHRLRHRPAHLSGGERQRVAIARALMNQPRVVFADEPTGNLDADTGRQIMSVLERLHQQKGQTIVLVTHDRSLAQRADRVLVLDGGELGEVASGEGEKCK
ncbi:MAG: ABC transporter ATP-binding protein [Tepidisphaeraceae bacterium]|jgi:lipoprotein-releasing system ATP-binding protein